MNKIKMLGTLAVAGLAFSCGKDEKRPENSVVPAVAPTPAPDTSTPSDTAPFVSFSEKSLVECQTNDLIATHCRIKGMKNKLALTSAVASNQPISVEIQCSAGKFNNMDFGFRLRRTEGPSPTIIECQTPEPKIYKVQGSGDLELFVDNPELLHTLRVSKNFVLEVKSIDGVPYLQN